MRHEARKPQGDNRKPQGNSGKHGGPGPAKTGGGSRGGKQSAKRGESVFTPPPLTTAPPLSGVRQYREAMHNGIISDQARHAVSQTGFNLKLSIDVADEPIAGRTAKCIANWRIACSNPWTLAVAEQGYKIQWKNKHPRTPWRSGNPRTDKAGEAVLDAEVEAMLKKRAIKRVTPSDREVVSGFFARPKRTPGKWRPIVSLKHTNKYIRKTKFRMTTVRDIKH